jgi:hypothetical protein
LLHKNLQQAKKIMVYWPRFVNNFIAESRRILRRLF